MLSNIIKQPIIKIFSKFGYTISYNADNLLLKISADFKDIYYKTAPYTQTSPERIYAMYKATQYISENKIKGDIVECGVWKGGSIMVSALVLKKLKDTKRKLYLYDTYEGMSKPEEIDTQASNNLNGLRFWKSNQTNTVNKWNYVSLEEVERNLSLTKYPKENLIFVKGLVEDTIPKNAPSVISLLRLDTDFYKSTYHELQYLFPRLSQGGIIIFDDYASWRGAKKAIDKYFKEKNIKIFIIVLDKTGLIGVK